MNKIFSLPFFVLPLSLLLGLFLRHFLFLLDSTMLSRFSWAIILAGAALLALAFLFYSFKHHAPFALSFLDFLLIFFLFFFVSGLKEHAWFDLQSQQAAEVSDTSAPADVYLFDNAHVRNDQRLRVEIKKAAQHIRPRPRSRHPQFFAPIELQNQSPQEFSRFWALPQTNNVRQSMEEKWKLTSFAGVKVQELRSEFFQLLQQRANAEGKQLPKEIIVVRVTEDPSVFIAAEQRKVFYFLLGTLFVHLLTAEMVRRFFP
ncbi:MAG: hypothetical protein COX62_06255 [Deltaproteobacteria bacterium CG_4_10_14_0_2_um_filter_43_8]|nr:MAG: hypothetical protein COV43_07495 [Deltaproteobacteria bacterium CG11_big_fil_rev_8_21_14_0_20_42_23]PJA19654.1 MAG: hypothetical protein COX62_06255 [Deltaproteobacteria bacterium CG_4_10_14_0_2_um_filter_43_8]PJC63717.1 MAG: hypothetical protein CO021_08050 [Deltaproteobacteria bacterium CG_4_9_14_0_2_um_filter_42_21]